MIEGAATHALRGLYHAILDRDPVEDTPQAALIRASIRRQHRAELNAVARLLQQGGSPAPRDPASVVRAVLIKPVNDACNLRCTYCYEGAEESRSLGERMSIPQLMSLTQQILASPRRDIQFLWHGGEPLLMGRNFYKAAVDAQARFNVHGTTVYNAIQTNGLLLDKRWVEFLKAHRFGLSVSIDGPGRMTDRYRIDAKGRGIIGRLLDKIALLNCSGVAFNAIAVIGSDHVGKARSFWSFIRESGIKQIDLHPSNAIGGRSGEPLSPKAYADFVNEVFDLWMEAADPDQVLVWAEDFFRLLAGNPPQTCYYAGTCSDIDAIEGNGAAIPCTRPFDRGEHVFGNSREQIFGDIVTGPKFTSFRERDLAAQAEASRCRWFDLCHNGCPQQRLKGEVQDIGGVGYYCQCRNGGEGGHFAMWEHIYQRVRATFRVEEDESLLPAQGLPVGDAPRNEAPD